MAHQDYQIYATDSLVERGRFARTVVLMLWILSTFIFPLGFAQVTKDWWGVPSIGLFVGLLAQVVVIAMTIHRFVVQVGSMRAFVTINQLRTLFGGQNSPKGRKHDGDTLTYVVYGPGTHISFPWEARDATRNVSLEETSEGFEVTIQTPKGELTIKGSLRLRADITRLVPFLGGVAVMAGDVTDLIKSFLIGKFANRKSVLGALKAVPTVNKQLENEFTRNKSVGNPISEFEERFGVSVGDITLSEILPSPELRKTMTGITEAEIIAEGAAITAGFPDGAKQAREAINNGTFTQADLNEARDRFMAASDNIKMNLDANEYRIKLEGLENLDPDLVKAIVTIGPLLASRMAKGSPQKKGK